MSAPVTTARVTPVGLKLRDGYQSFLAFERDPNISFWEISITPLGMDGGEPIDITTMWNTRWRTKALRKLIEATELSITAAYDPILYDQILNLINEEGSITLHFPDGSTLDFYGAVRTANFAELAEGTFPQVTMAVEVTNYDPVAGTEEDPVLTSVAGT